MNDSNIPKLLGKLCIRHFIMITGLHFCILMGNTRDKDRKRLGLRDIVIAERIRHAFY
jgi:hypothetical protein